MDGEDNEEEPRQAVIVYLKLANAVWGDPDEYDAYFELEEVLRVSIDASGVGEFDGYARGLGFFDMYMYGPDADALWQVAEPAVRQLEPRVGSYVVKRYGAADDPDAREVRIDL